MFRIGLQTIVFTSTIGLFASQALANPEQVPGQLIVRYNPQTGPGAQAFASQALSASVGAIVVERLQSAPIEIWNYEGDSDAIIRQLENDPRIAYVEPNYIVHAFQLPNDPLLGSQYALTKIAAPNAWELQAANRDDLVVAVIDTGVALNHPDLAANIWTNPGETGNGKETDGQDNDANGFIDDVHGWDFFDHDNDPTDQNGHGSHIAGIIGAVGHNGRGGVGVAWKHVKIMPLRFLGPDGGGPVSQALLALDYAINKGVKITSNSWGFPGPRSGQPDYPQALEDMITYANTRGVLVIAAAGNEHTDNDSDDINILPTYPSSYRLPNLLSVAAVDSADQLASFSNIGKETVHLAAPGVSIVSTGRSGDYVTMSGTSMACPHVSGVAALLWAEAPEKSMAEIRDAILTTGDSISSLVGKTVTGRRLNAYAALLKVRTTPNQPPTVNLVSPSAGASLHGTVTLVATATDSDGSVRALSFNLPDGARAGQQIDPTNPGRYSYNWNTVGIANGTVSISVTAVDDSGAATQSSPISLTINNQQQQNHAPIVSFTQPDIGTTISGTIMIQARVSDSDGDPIDWVKFIATSRLNGMSVTITATETQTGLFSASWNTTVLPNSIVDIYATAQDNHGAEATPISMSVVLANLLQGTAPQILSRPPYQGSPDSLYEVRLAASGSPQIYWTAINIPTGAELNSATGDLRWWPLSSGGTFLFEIKAYNSFGESVPLRWSVSVTSSFSGAVAATGCSQSTDRASRLDVDLALVIIAGLLIYRSKRRALRSSHFRSFRFATISLVAESQQSQFVDGLN